MSATDSVGSYVFRFAIVTGKSSCFIMTKPRWTRIPPCANQINLEKMFAAGKIAPDAQASSVYNDHSEFQKYKLDVFRVAFNETRSKLGYERKQFLFLSDFGVRVI